MLQACTLQGSRLLVEWFLTDLLYTRNAKLLSDEGLFYEADILQFHSRDRDAEC